MVKRKKVIPARSYFTPSICLLLLPTPALFPSSSFSPLLSALPPPSHPLHLSFSPSIFLFLSVTLSLLRLPASLSFPLSWCKVMEAGVCGFPRARLRDYTARSHERFMMLGSVCVCMNVCHSRQALTGKREQGDTEKKGKKVGGIEGTDCETNWQCTAGLTLQAVIIPLFCTFSDAILAMSVLEKWWVTKVLIRDMDMERKKHLYLNFAIC